MILLPGQRLKRGSHVDRPEIGAVSASDGHDVEQAAAWNTHREDDIAKVAGDVAELLRRYNIDTARHDFLVWIYDCIYVCIYGMRRSVSTLNNPRMIRRRAKEKEELKKSEEKQTVYIRALSEAFLFSLSFLSFS